MTKRISTSIYEWIDEALEAHKDSEQVRWDAQFVMDQNGPAIVAFFVLPGAVLGSEVRTVVQFTNLTSMGADDVARVVRQTVENLLGARSAQLVSEKKTVTSKKTGK